LKIGWKSVAWSAAALLLLLSIPTKLIVVTLFLLMVPLVVLYTMLKPIPFLVHAACIGAASFALLGSYSLIPLTFGFFFLIPSAIMGHMYKRRLSARTVVTVATIVLLAQFLVQLTIFSIQYDIDLSAELSGMIEEALKQLQTSGTLLPANWASDAAVSIGDAFVKMLPSLLLLSSFLLAVVTHALSRRALGTMGIVVPAMPPMKNWMLPRSLVLYYLIALILSYAISPDNNGFWGTVAANAVPILQFAFIVQAIAFFYYLADMKKWPRAAPFLIAIVILLFHPFYLVGLIDTAFPLRRYFTKQ